MTGGLNLIFQKANFFNIIGEIAKIFLRSIYTTIKECLLLHDAAK